MEPPLVVARRLTADEWETDRALRLAALAESPDAFASTLEQESRISGEEWRERVAGRVRFAARLDGTDAGLAGLILGPRGSTAILVSVWVAPSARGQGVGDALVQAAVAHARENGATAVHLWVTSGNTPAESLYARNGFVHTSEVQPIDPATPSPTEFGMTRVFKP